MNQAITYKQTSALTVVGARESTPTQKHTHASNHNDGNVGVQVHAPTETNMDVVPPTKHNTHASNYNDGNVGVQVHAPTTTPTKQTFVKYNRKSYRHNGHDYDGGLYFITVCTKNYHHYFGKIDDGKMTYSTLGMFVNNNIADLKRHHPYCDPIQWQVMPNHIHAIIYINPDLVGVQVNAPTETTKCVGARESTPIKPFRNSPLGTVVGCLKAAVTTFARQNGNNAFSWQPRFHDRIIRNMYEASHISDYIRDNVAKWNGKIEDHNSIMNSLHTCGFNDNDGNVGVQVHAPTEINIDAMKQTHTTTIECVGARESTPTKQHTMI